MLTEAQRKRLAELTAKQATDLSDAEKTELKSLIAIASGTEEKEFELDQDSLNEIAKHVNVDIEAIAKSVVEQLKASGDKPANKSVGATSDVTAETIEKMQPGERIRKHLMALRQKDVETAQKYNQYNVETLVKAGYMNETVAADGGGFVPPADLLDNVFSLEKNYGIAARLCRTVNVNSNSIKAAALSSTVSFTEVAEAGVKATTKPVFAYPSVSLREFAGIAVLTDELLEDAAFDIQGFLAGEFAKAAAKKEDELLLTDSTTGLLAIAGTVVTRIGAALANLDGDDVITAHYSVPASSQNGGSWILSTVAIPALRKLKDSTGNYLWGGGLNGGATNTLDGAPVYTSDVMPTAATGTSVGYGVFGNFGEYAVLIRKVGIKLTFHDSGTVNVGGTDYNLIQQDMQALRAVIRRNIFIPLPGAFAVLKSDA